jgi:hypothetical protein
MLRVVPQEQFAKATMPMGSSGDMSNAMGLPSGLVRSRYAESVG